MKLKKTFENGEGKIIIRDCRGSQPTNTLVEMFDTRGFILCFWNYDEKGQIEMVSVDDRPAKVEDSFDLLGALRYGFELAKLISYSDQS